MANVYLGNNLIRNCDAALVVNGVEVFRLRERTSDGKLLVDFDIRDKAGGRIAKIAKNDVVFVDPEFESINLAQESMVREKTTGRVIARVEELETGTIRITGEFWIEGFRASITADDMTLDGIYLSGNTFDGSGNAIVLEPGSTFIGSAGTGFGG